MWSESKCDSKTEVKRRQSLISIVKKLYQIALHGATQQIFWHIRGYTQKKSANSQGIINTSKGIFLFLPDKIMKTYVYVLRIDMDIVKSTFSSLLPFFIKCTRVITVVSKH